MEMDINKRIKKLRNLIGVSQSDFAEDLRVPQNRIARIELNKNQPTMELLKSICSTYEVSLDWLANGEGTIFKDGSNVYKKKTNIYAPKNLISVILTEIERLLPDIDIDLKANIIATYCEYFAESTNYELIKKEIAGSFKIMAYLLGDKT
jgi:transcriptional regulator with XRE-family HTH domain